MISWRWPRPIAVMASIALMPVCIGSVTGWRAMTFGAWISSSRRSVDSMSPLPSSGRPERVDHPAEEAVADRDREHVAGPADLLALLDALRVAEDDAADLADVEVQRDAEQAAFELQQLVGHRGVQPLDPGDAVAGLDDDADLVALGLRVVGGDDALEGVADLLRADAQLGHSVLLNCDLCHGPVRAWARPAGQSAARLVELTGNAGVDQLVADPYGEPADQRRVDDDLQADVVGEGAAERRGEVGLLLRR